MGAHMAALAEGMALAEKCDLDPLTLLEVKIDLIDNITVVDCSRF